MIYFYLNLINIWNGFQISSRSLVLMKYPQNELIGDKTGVLWRALALRWRHNGHDGVSNHQPRHCLLNRLFGCRSKKTSKLRVTGFVRGIHRRPGNSPHKWPVTPKIVLFDDVIMDFWSWQLVIYQWMRRSCPSECMRFNSLTTFLGQWSSRSM